MKKTAPTSALLRSSGYHIFDRKIGGLYLLERNIRLLWQAGYTDIYLDLSDREREFTSDKIIPRLTGLKGLSLTLQGRLKPKKEYILIDSTLFIQYFHLLKFEQYFGKKGRVYHFHPDSESFIIKRPHEARKAEKISLKHIRLSAGGFFARNINKRISLPLSLLLARAGISPNLITLVNFIITLIGGSLLWKGGYWNYLIAGAVFQIVSIIDGCDGEVAKLNCRFSKIGSIFDTVNDYFCLIYYFAGITYVFYKTEGTGLLFSLALVGFAGIFTMMAAIIAYLIRFSSTGSFVAYNRDFMDRLPLSDPLAWIAVRLQYATRKEFYSLITFILAIPGLIYLMVPYVAVVTSVGGIVLVLLDFKYFPKFARMKLSTEMTYISRRSK